MRQSSLAHAHPITMATRNEKGKRGAAGMRDSHSFLSRQASSASCGSIEGYIDTVVDNYVVIEASPSGSGSSSQSSHEVSTN